MKILHRPHQIGDTIAGGSVGVVVESRDPSFQVGDIAVTFAGWQEYAVAKSVAAQKFDPALGSPSFALGGLGLNGHFPHY